MKSEEQFGGVNPLCLRGAEWSRFSATRRRAFVRSAYLYWRRSGLPISQPTAALPFGLSIIGLGQLGQAYLSLLYFICRNTSHPPFVVLIDKDEFEPPNQHTQILLAEHADWDARPKSTYLANVVTGWGWTASELQIELNWTWKRPQAHPGVAMLGLDDLDVRRMAIAAGYEWVIDAGLGTSFTQPRLSCHSLPSDNGTARALFGKKRPAESLAFLENTPLYDQLTGTPGRCGWVTFQGATAAAPSMGIAAAAYAIAELLNLFQSTRSPVAGRACLWSPFLPYCRTPITAAAKEIDVCE